MFNLKSRSNKGLAKKFRQSLRHELRMEALETRKVFAGLAPVAVNDVYEAVAEQTLQVATSGVLANDTDAENDSLTALQFSGPQHGSLNLLSDGSFEYTPDPGFSGIDGFAYQADDGTSQSALAAVTIRVIDPNVAPEGTNDAYFVDEDGVLTIGAEQGVLANDTDANGDSLTAELVDAPASGMLEFETDGGFSYTPNPDFNGTDTFTYRVSDGELQSDLVVVEITVNPVNDAPVAMGEEFTTDEDQPLELPAAALLDNDTDVDGDPLAVVIDQEPTNGSLIANEDGSFTYTPDPDFNGSDAFSYFVTDGELQSEVVMAQINVSPANDAPQAVGEQFTIDEDQPLSTTKAELLANDTDPDGDDLSFVLGDEPQHGALVLGEDGSVTYTPDPDFNGTDAFTYSVSDGELQSDLVVVEITVNPVNDAPVAMGEEFTTDEDQPLELPAAALLDNDTDVDGDPLAVVIDQEPTSGSLIANEDGSFTYTPDPDFSGEDMFSYRVSDGEAESEAVTAKIILTAVTDNPIAQNDFYNIDEDMTLEVMASGVLENDLDPDGDPLVAELVNLPEHGTINFAADGSFEYTPEANFNGTDAFTYRVSDGTALSDLGVVEIVVNPVNDAPVAVDDQFEILSGGPLIVEAAGVLANDSDVEGDMLTAAVDVPPAHGTLELAEDGSFVYTPEPGYAGSDQFSYFASDGIASTSATVMLTVQGGNMAPVANNDSYAIEAGLTLAIDALAGVTANDVDPNGDPLTATLFRGPQHGELILEADGSFTYMAAADYAGIDSFIYRVNDGELTSGLAVVTLHVSPASEIGPQQGGGLAVLATALTGGPFSSALHADDSEEEPAMEDIFFAEFDPVDLLLLEISCVHDDTRVRMG